MKSLNYFELGKELHELQNNLQIVLIFRGGVVTDLYAQALQDSGISVINNEDHEKLNQLLGTLDKPIDLPTFTGEMVLIILQEISTISSKHFGSLALGNYWRKSHAQVSIKSPFIQNWTADHFGKISCNEIILEQELTDEDMQVVRLWVKRFIEECERAKVNFREILDDSNISLMGKYFLGN